MLDGKTYTYDARPEFPFRVMGTRYANSTTPTGQYTLVLFHATGLHKETWEPMLRYLFSIASTSGTDGKAKESLLREAWSIECPNHGKSAVLNEKELEKYDAENDSWNGYLNAESAHRFLSSNPGGIDLTTHSLIYIGHSMGCASVVLLQTFTPSLPMTSLILCDPTIREQDRGRDAMYRILTHITWAKRDVWLNHEDARKDLAKTPGFRNWDGEVLGLFVEKALRSHPAKRHLDPFAFTGITLSCTKAREAAVYRYNNHQPHAHELLHRGYVSGLPTHLIFSRKDEFGAEDGKKALAAGIYGRGARSVRWIEVGGHMFVQSQPEATANAIWNVLLDVSASESESSRARL